jgi:ribosomal protein S1
MAVTEPLSSEALKDVLSTIRAGEVRTGRVISVEDREVLVELDGFSGPGKAVGRIPRGDLTHKAIEHPSEAVSIGQRLAFEVAAVDWRQERVRLAGRSANCGPAPERTRSSTATRERECAGPCPGRRCDKGSALVRCGRPAAAST